MFVSVSVLSGEVNGNIQVQGVLPPFFSHTLTDCAVFVLLYRFYLCVCKYVWLRLGKVFNLSLKVKEETIKAMPPLLSFLSHSFFFFFFFFLFFFFFPFFCYKSPDKRTNQKNTRSFPHLTHTRIHLLLSTSVLLLPVPPSLPPYLCMS